jgi:MSHA biogenesis protein MshL
MMNTSEIRAHAQTGIAYLILVSALALVGCAQVKEKPVLPTIQDELRKAAAASQAKPEAKPLPAAVEAALAPQTRLELPKAAAQPAETRFDLAVNAAPAQQVFLGIASGTRYSMLLHPEVAGSITVNLKDVNVPEAMDALRELYGYDYRIDGNRIFVQPLTTQTRFYTINYPSSLRQGKSELRVISGAVTDSNSSTGTGGTTTATSSKQLETTRLSTEEKSDFWGELQAGVGMMIGCSSAAGVPACPAGRSVMISPHTSMLAVRALPMEQRQVAEYLQAAKVSVERQVMIEAKILEVTLNEGAQSGINWTYFKQGANRLSKGAAASQFPVPPGAPVSSTSVGGLLASGLSATSAANTASAGIFGLAFQTSSFAALINFLETQGGVQVLSSPRIAAINNQKAVLKVGTDEFFVTNVSTTTNTGTGSGTTTPNVTLQPFFSGISLDVTPQIDDGGNIILHVHPTVSQVTTVEKSIDLGSGTGSIGTLKLPLASSTISEADSMVRLKDGEIAAIGGLMKRQSSDTGSGVPGLGDIPGLGVFFKNTNNSRLKQELVILLKPTVIRQQSDWMEGVRDASARMQNFGPPPAQK